MTTDPRHRQIIKAAKAGDVAAIHALLEADANLLKKHS
jgi:hypothetical protein